jgi:hypothetical protein
LKTFLRKGVIDENCFSGDDALELSAGGSLWFAAG